MSRLDDEEQVEWIRRWSSKQRRMQAEILQARTAYRDGAISWIRMPGLCRPALGSAGRA